MDDNEVLQVAIKEVREELREIRQQIAALQQFRWMFVGGIGVIVILIIPILVDLFAL